MRVIPVAAVFLAVLPAFGAPSGAPIAAVAAASAEGRALAIDKTIKRIDYLVGQGKKDRFELMVDVYRGYSDVQLKEPKRGITLDNLLDIVKADNVAKDVRTRAAETIYLDRVPLNDPTLSMDGRREKRNRAIFSMKVNKLLSDSDPFQRQLAKQILEGLWLGWGPRVPAIKNCDPRDKDSCLRAQKEWERVFKGG